MASAAASKKAANRLVVEEAATNDDNSVCNLHPATMEKLSIFQGDIVLLKGKHCHTAAWQSLNAYDEHKSKKDPHGGQL